MEERPERVCRSRRRLDLSESESVQLQKDLQTFSARQEPEGAVYPPYLQMFIDHVWRSLGNQSGTYRFDRYIELPAEWRE